MTVEPMVDAIMAEMDRIWGPPGFDGTWEQVAWLEAIYGVTEDEDIRWQFILEYWYPTPPDESPLEFFCDPEDLGYLDPDDSDDVALAEFLDDEGAVMEFLQGLLKRYRAGQLTWSERSPEEIGYHIEGKADGSSEEGWGETCWYWVDDANGQRSVPFTTYLEARADRIATVKRAPR